MQELLIVLKVIGKWAKRWWTKQSTKQVEPHDTRAAVTYEIQSSSLMRNEHNLEWLAIDKSIQSDLSGMRLVPNLLNRQHS